MKIHERISSWSPKCILVLVWRNGKKLEVILSCRIELGRMGLCKSSTCTRRSARLHRQSRICHGYDMILKISKNMHHDPWLVSKLLIKAVMKQQITQAMGWLVVKKFELILFDRQNCLIGTFL